MKRTLVIMAKAPVPGMVKTRLCPPLEPGAAAELHRCFVLDAVDKSRLVIHSEVALAYAPGESSELFERLAPDVSRCMPQEGRDLGERMSNCFSALCKPGMCVVLIGTDAPTLPSSVLQKAFNVIESKEADVVFGPAADGGYYLIGMARAHPELFADIAWGTAEVLKMSLERVQSAGLKASLLPEWKDIDTPEDLLRLAEELLEGEAPNRYFPCHTAAWVSAARQ